MPSPQVNFTSKGPGWCCRGLSQKCAPTHGECTHSCAPPQSQHTTNINTKHSNYNNHTHDCGIHMCMHACRHAHERTRAHNTHADGRVRARVHSMHACVHACVCIHARALVCIIAHVCVCMRSWGLMGMHALMGTHARMHMGTRACCMGMHACVLAWAHVRMCTCASTCACCLALCTGAGCAWAVELASIEFARCDRQRLEKHRAHAFTHMHRCTHTHTRTIN